MCFYPSLYSIFFFNDPSPTEIYTLSLHDALPILRAGGRRHRDGLEPDGGLRGDARQGARLLELRRRDRKSTRLNSSHVEISYAVFCLKIKKTATTSQAPNTM